MEVIGVVAEYNPFHNGHMYHLNKIKELYPDSIVILVLNGYFLERGDISILTKEDKTKIALRNGIDVVVELPFMYGTQSADIFADISIKILNNYKVSKIVFGSECNDVRVLEKIADNQENDEFHKKVKMYLDEGMNYPSSLARACEIDFSFNPNDLLGISYIKAIRKNNFEIEPISIKRTSDYHDITSNSSVVSASNIRSKINNNEDISKYVSDDVISNIVNVNYDIYFKLLKEKIVTSDNLSDYLDVDEGIEYRLKKVINRCNSVQELISLVKTKRYTYNKINRMLVHILIGLKKSDNTQDLDYTKILGINNKGLKYLNSIKKDLGITNVVNTKSNIYQYELKASIIYDLINNTNTYAYEIKSKPVIKVNPLSRTK